MEVPSSVGPLAQRWDEEQVGLATAARTIGSAAVGGFTSSVAAEAVAFTAAWEQLATGAASACGGRADALRDTLADVTVTDTAVAQALGGPR